MTVDHGELLVEIVEFVNRTQGQVPPYRYFQRHPVDDEDLLAELIEADGRARAALGKLVRLADYERAVPDLHNRTAPLDAAISAVLRCHRALLAPGGNPVTELIREHPALKRAILDAAMLDTACASPKRVRRSPSELPRWPLPHEFGPILEDDQRRYVLEERRGAGAFGEVYRARDRLMGDGERQPVVAVKILATRGLGRRARHRLLEEGVKARRIEHPSVVRALDRGVSDDGFDYIVFEYIQGGDLQHWVRDQGGRLPTRLAVRLMAQIARGVDAAHHAGLAHCDLKPANILMGPSGEPKITDFGVAARLDGEDADQVEGTYLRHAGSLAFIAPETLLRMPEATSPSVDIYAMGGLLFWMLTGRLANGRTPAEIVDRMTSRNLQPVSLREHRRSIDRELEQICRNATQPKPSDRFHSADEMADDLEAWLEGKKTSMAPHDPMMAIRRSWRRRPRALLLWLALLGTIAASVILTRLAIQRERAVQSMPGVDVATPRDRPAGATRPDLERWIAQAAAAGRMSDHQTLLWRSQLAWLLLESGEPISVIAMLDQDEPIWRARLSETDLWLRRLEVLRACAEVDGGRRDPRSLAPHLEAIDSLPGFERESAALTTRFDRANRSN